MLPVDLWKRIICQLSIESCDFKTVPKINREPVWFNAESDGESIFVDRARHNQPSSQIATKRKITYSDFETVFEYYQRWRHGVIGIRNEVRQLSRNTAYIFALISYFHKDEFVKEYK